MPTPKSEEAAALLQTALNAFPIQVVVLDSDGVIRYTNRAWRTFGTANGLEEPVTEDTDYLAVCDAADAAPGPAAADGIRALLRGDRDEFTMEYDCHGPETRRWFSMRATRFEAPLEGPAGGTYALVAHLDITDRKVAERAAEAVDVPASVEDPVPVDLATLARTAWADLADPGPSLSVEGSRRIEADQALLRSVLRRLFRSAAAAEASAVTVTATDDGFAVLDDGRPLAERPVAPDGDATAEGTPAVDAVAGASRAVVRRVADAHDWTVDVTDRPEGGVRVHVGV